MDSDLTSNEPTIENQHEIQDTEKNEKAAFGLYITRREADWAVRRLEKNGFNREDISILAPQAYGHRNFVYEQRTNIREGALIGALAGFFILGLVGFIWGFGDRRVTENLLPFWFLTTGLGCFLGLLFGAASGALAGIGMPKSAAKRYGFYLKEGGIILSVQVRNEKDRARVNQILESTRAQDIAELKESEIWRTIVPEKKKLIFN